jgi:sarcosine oxidase subunit alpha
VSQRFRAAEGGLVDRGRRLRFRFDGSAYEGFAGDTLASALLANGVSVVGRSFKYHRRRGVYGIGAEEPSALVELGAGGRREPNLRATQVELYDGLVARSQNRWPSLGFDLGAVNNLASRFLPAGFYYKTFMWPRSWWMRYEGVIRAAAGLGRAPRAADPDHYFKRFAHCDVLVVGAGAAGLMAALSAARAGARTILVDEQPRPGGQLRREDHAVDGLPGHAWAQGLWGELAAMPGVRVLGRACAFGYYDDDLVAVCERVADHLGEPAAYQPRQRVWWIRARQVVLATGAIERPLVFAGNDLPGVMLASAAAGHAREFAVRPGRRAVLFANNDAAYDCARALHGVGVQVRAIVDSRPEGAAAPARALAVDAGAEIVNGAVVAAARGGGRVRAASVHALRDGGLDAAGRLIDCDLLCVSGGFNPTVHLFSQSLGTLRWDEAAACFVPRSSFRAERSCGAARGVFGLAECLADGARAGAEAARSAGFEAAVPTCPVTDPTPDAAPIMPLWEVPRPRGHRGKCFVDLQNDVTSDDVRLAARESYRSVEHLKRYTTLGMGTDQGRTSNVNGLAIMAATLGRDIGEMGTTTFRPPYAPVTLGALAGAEVGMDVEPVRRTPLHDWHVAAGAVMQNVGLWQRARYYPRRGEAMRDAVEREALHVREAAGIVDVSTFGKIDVRGCDAAEFLERVAINRFRNLGTGRCRYHVMLREDGFVMDDGTTTRIAEHAFYLTTTTAAAGTVMSHLEFCAQALWPDLDVHLTSVSDQWGGLALAGPRAREVLAQAVEGADVGHEALPQMASTAARIAGVPVRVLRVTFSGELGYEVHMPADWAVPVWEAVVAAGRAFGLELYGTEAMAVLRIEKGHVVHAELDGRTVPSDLGFDRMIRKDTDFIGRRALDREGLERSRRRRLVGLESVDGAPVPAGAHLVWNPTAPKPLRTYGHVTSTCWSPNLRKHIALALVEDAAHWKGRTLYAASPLARAYAQVRVVDPVMFDPEGRRARV